MHGEGFWVVRAGAQLRRRASHAASWLRSGLTTAIRQMRATSVAVPGSTADARHPQRHSNSSTSTIIVAVINEEGQESPAENHGRFYTAIPTGHNSGELS